MRTAESVSMAHPDKIADQISDNILDKALEDPYSKVAVETLVGHGKCYLLGEVTSNTKIDFKEAAREILEYFGYKGYKIVSNIVSQSKEISEEVQDGGAGDQGIMVGYACNETSELLPLEFYIARNLTRAMGKLDGKAQVTVENNKIVRLVTSVGGEYPRELLELIESLEVKEPVWIRNQYETAGLDSDTGLTGRKIVVDAYGPRVPVGGGAFSGKDPSKVDRSAAYMARKVAVDLLKKYEADEVIVKLAYSIGLSKELMATADITKDGKVKHLDNLQYDFSPLHIIDYLDLRTPQYLNTARYGHFNTNKWDI